MKPPKDKKLSTAVLKHGNADLRFVRAAFGTMHDLVAVCDPYGRITLINHAMALFSGVDQDGTCRSPGRTTARSSISTVNALPMAASR